MRSVSAARVVKVAWAAWVATGPLHIVLTRAASHHLNRPIVTAAGSY